MDSNRRVLLATSLYHLTNDAAVSVMAGEITVLRTALKIDYVGVGTLTGVALLVTVVCQIAFGKMSDRRDPARFLPIGIAILGLASIAIAAAWAFLPFLALVAVSRIGSSFYHPVGISWIGRAYAGRNLDRAMGFQSSFGDVGEIFGMGSGAVLGVVLGWQVPFIAWGVLNLAAVVVGWSLVRDAPRLPAPAPVAVSYRSILFDVRYWLVPIAIGGASFTIVMTFGPLLVRDVFAQSDAFSGVSIALWILVGSVAAFSFGRLSARFGRYRILMAAHLLFAIATGVASTLGFAPALLALWTLGAALFITYPALFSFVSEASRVRGAAFGVIFGFQLAGGAAAAYGAGLLAQTTGSPAVPFLLAAALSGLGFLYLLAIRRRAEPARRTPAIGAPQA